jgi:outer membrane protein assembly factor BamB
VIYREGVLYACRGYNAWLAGRKGIVTAIDAATGELRWRSDAKVCGGGLDLIDDYVVTGYGAADTPYAVKLLRRADGSLAQSLPLFGAILEFSVSGNDLVASTYKHRVTYVLLP